MPEKATLSKEEILPISILLPIIFDINIYRAKYPFTVWYPLSLVKIIVRLNTNKAA